MKDFNLILDTLIKNDNKQLISFISDKDLHLKMDNLQQHINISIGLSAAITAYARIHKS
jgi:hypothetical protein